jgi:hypothetical protein
LVKCNTLVVRRNRTRLQSQVVNGGRAKAVRRVRIDPALVEREDAGAQRKGFAQIA